MLHAEPRCPASVSCMVPHVSRCTRVCSVLAKCLSMDLWAGSNARLHPVHPANAVPVLSFPPHCCCVDSHSPRALGMTAVCLRMFGVAYCVTLLTVLRSCMIPTVCWGGGVIVFLGYLAGTQERVLCILCVAPAGSKQPNPIGWLCCFVCVGLHAGGCMVVSSHKYHCCLQKAAATGILTAECHLLNLPLMV